MGRRADERFASWEAIGREVDEAADRQTHEEEICIDRNEHYQVTSISASLKARAGRRPTGTQLLPLRSLALSPYLGAHPLTDVPPLSDAIPLPTTGVFVAVILPNWSHS